MKIYVFSFPEDTNLGMDGVKQSHISLVYGSYVEVDIDFNEVRDPCFLKFYPTGAEDEEIEKWCEDGRNRFFFQQVDPGIQSRYQPL